jgi:hypothetical protein
VIEDGGDALRSEFVHSGGHVLGAIVDRDRAEHAHAILLSRTGGPDHPNAGVACELDQSRSDAAGRTQHHDRPALPSPAPCLEPCNLARSNTFPFVLKGE